MGAVVGAMFGLGLALVWHAIRHPGWAPSRQRRGGTRLGALATRAGLPDLRARHIVGSSAACGLTGFVIVAGLSRVLVIAVAFGSFAASGPVVFLRSRARRRAAELRAAWPDVVDNLASGVRAGLSLPESVAALAERGPEPLRPTFAAFAADYRASGRFEASLEALGARLLDPAGDRVIEALRVAREVGGGDLGRLLRTLSAFLRDDARTRAELEARQAWTVSAARLALVAPWLLLLLLSTRPAAVAAYQSTAGAVVLAGGGACSLLAYRLMLRLGRLPA